MMRAAAAAAAALLFLCTGSGGHAQSEESYVTVAECVPRDQFKLTACAAARRDGGAGILLPSLSLGAYDASFPGQAAAKSIANEETSIQSMSELALALSGSPECAQAVLMAACSAMGPACNVTADGTEVEIWGSGEANSCASSMPACVNSPIIATLLASQNTSKEEALHMLCDPVDDMESLPVTTLPAVALKNPCVSPDEAKQLPAFDADCASVMTWHTPMGQSGYSKLPNFPGYEKAPLDVLTDMLRNVSGTYDECASASKALLNLTCAMEYPMCDPSTHHVMYGASGTFSNCDTLFSEDPVVGSLAACAAAVPMADPRYLPMQALLGALPSFAPAMCSAFSPPEPSPPKSSNSTGEGGDGGESSHGWVVSAVAFAILAAVVVACALYYAKTRRQTRIDDFGSIFADESEPLGAPMGVTK